MTKLTTVVVTYNSADTLEGCLQAAVRWLPPEGRIVVVDNASTDESVAIARRFPQVQVLANRHNAGFGAACNQGAAHAPAEFYLFLNPDVRLLTAVDPLMDAARQSGYGGATGLLLDGDGDAPQRGFGIRKLPTPTSLTFETLGLNRLAPRNAVNRRYRCLDHSYDHACDTEQPAGAFLLVRREAWDMVGGFNEDFHPVWFEDVDLCKRLADAGFKLRYLPEARAAHVGGHSVKHLPSEARLTYWYGSLLKYSSLHFQPFGRNAVRLSVVMATLLRGSVAMLPRPGIPARNRAAALRPFGTVVREIGDQLRNEWERRRPLAEVRGEARTAVK